MVEAAMASSQQLVFVLQCLSLLILCSLLVEAQSTNFTFLDFTSPDGFTWVEDVQHYAKNSSFVLNAENKTCAKLVYSERVRMKDAASGAVASFSTAFTFEITGPNEKYRKDFGYLHADGMAFAIMPDNNLLDKSGGSSLCLLTVETDGNDSNHVFAVEFDTYISAGSIYNDPSDSHIGVNVNSMKSTSLHNLCESNQKNCSYLCNGGVFTAWIDYNSTLCNLEVRFAKGSLSNNIRKPRKALIKAILSLDEVFHEWMHVGFTGSTGSYTEAHRIASWKFASYGMPKLRDLPPSPSPLAPPLASGDDTVPSLSSAPSGPSPSSPPGLLAQNPPSTSSSGKNAGLVSRVCTVWPIGAFLLVFYGSHKLEVPII